jgi:CelD/BcsL family acetyltransferase involved in cellulose biosynthesis
LTTLEELDAEAERWRALDEAATAPAQRFAWVRACAASFGEDLRIVLAEEDGDLVAAAPLHYRDGVLELLGASDLYEPGDLAYRDEAALGALVSSVASLKMSVVVPRILASSPTVGALRRAFRARGLVLTRPAGATPVLELGRDELETRFSARRRGDIRRARRRAEEIGPVSAEVLEPVFDEIGPLLEEFFGVEAAGWKGARGTALAQDPSRRRFFEEYAAASAADGTLRVSRLRIAGETAAVQLAVEHAGRLWLLKIGYDERFARCSPGTLLLLETARWAAGKGLDAIELLGSRESWTLFWTEEERECVALHAYPALGGVRSLLGGAVGHTRRRLAQGVIEQASRAHVAGPLLDDALEACRKVVDAGRGVALAYWDGPDDTPLRVQTLSLQALEALAQSGVDGYLSIKPAALAFSRLRIEALLSRADELGLAVHFDSTGLDEADPGWHLLEKLARPGLGCTLPARWGRSLADARRAVELGLRVRVVKGQWPDPDYWPRDEAERFLDIVDVVAGARHVAVATHDRPLAAAAIVRLARCEHELMLGLPWRGNELAPTRVYVPFGHPSLPYAPARARRAPRVARWVARDLLRGLRR